MADQQKTPPQADVPRIVVDRASHGDDEVRAIWRQEADGRLVLLALRSRRVGVEVSNG